MGDAISVSYSELSSYRRCPHQWWLSYRERWQRPIPSPALQRGSLWHEILAAHYRDGKVPEELFHTEGDQSEFQALCQWMYEGYVQHWADEDKGWKIRAVEQRINHMLPPIAGMKRPIRLTGILDLVAEEKTGLWLVDHKSHRNMPSDRQLELEDQMPLYAWLLKKMGKPIQGIIYNVARAFQWKDPARTPEFKRYYLSFPDDHLACVAREARMTVERMQAHTSLATSERNTGEHCQYMCDFTESCIAGRRGLDETEFMRDLKFARSGR